MNTHTDVRAHIAVFATLDATFLSVEGAGQWAAHAWLAHLACGGLVFGQPSIGSVPWKLLERAIRQ